MNDLLIALLVIWGLILTVVSLALVRQISLISVRLDLQMQLPELGEVGSGVDVGMPVESAALSGQGGDMMVVAVTGTCASCQVFIDSLEAGSTLRLPLVVLLAGKGPASRAAASKVPGWVQLIRDPTATLIGRELQLSQTLIALRIANGVVVGKAKVTGLEGIVELSEFEVQPGRLTT